MFSTVSLLREGQKQISTPLTHRVKNPQLAVVVELVFCGVFTISATGVTSRMDGGAFGCLPALCSSVPAWCGIGPISEIAHVSSEAPPRDVGDET